MNIKNVKETKEYQQEMKKLNIKLKKFSNKEITEYRNSNIEPKNFEISVIIESDKNYVVPLSNAKLIETTNKLKTKLIKQVIKEYPYLAKFGLNRSFLSIELKIPPVQSEKKRKENPSTSTTNTTPKKGYQFNHFQF